LSFARPCRFKYCFSDQGWPLISWSCPFPRPLALAAVHPMYLFTSFPPHLNLWPFPCETLPPALNPGLGKQGFWSLILSEGTPPTYVLSCAPILPRTCCPGSLEPCRSSAFGFFPGVVVLLRVLPAFHAHIRLIPSPAGDDPPFFMFLALPVLLLFPCVSPLNGERTRPLNGRSRTALSRCDPRYAIAT